MKKVTMTRRRASEEVELGGEETCKVALEHGGAAAISQRDICTLRPHCHNGATTTSSYGLSGEEAQAD